MGKIDSGETEATRRGITHSLVAALVVAGPRAEGSLRRALGGVS